MNSGRSIELPPVSVVIPTRNAESVIASALDSVAAQDYGGPVEVIVADGSDTPATSEVVARRYPAVRLVSNPQRTTPNGLNAALRVATGRVVVRCDCHAVLPPQYVRRAVETLERTGAAGRGDHHEAGGGHGDDHAVGSRGRPLPPLGGSDVTVRLGAVPRTLLLPAGHGTVTRTRLWQARPGAFLIHIEGVARFLVTGGRDVLIEPFGGGDEAGPRRPRRHTRHGGRLMRGGWASLLPSELGSSGEDTCGEAAPAWSIWSTPPRRRERSLDDCPHRQGHPATVGRTRLQVERQPHEPVALVVEQRRLGSVEAPQGVAYANQPRPRRSISPRTTISGHSIAACPCRASPQGMCPHAPTPISITLPVSMDSDS